MPSTADRFCPMCKIENSPGAVTCAFCNHPLLPAGSNESKPGLCPESTHSSSALSGHAPQGLLLSVPGFGRSIAIDGAQSFILGRNLEKTAGPQGETVLDLSPFEAVDSGVSRRHVLVRPIDGGYEICDMGSTNGTWLNQMRILPGRLYRLDEKSEIRLGRMVVHLIVRACNRRTNSLAG